MIKSLISQGYLIFEKNFLKLLHYWLIYHKKKGEYPQYHQLLKQGLEISEFYKPLLMVNTELLDQLSELQIEIGNHYYESQK